MFQLIGFHDGPGRPIGGARLSRNGTGLFMAGWVGAAGSIILIVLGSITFQQAPLLIGDLTLLACILLIVCGTMKMAAGRPSAGSRPGSSQHGR